MSWVDPSNGTDLRTALLYLLNYHQGKSNAIGRAELLHQLKKHGCQEFTERQVRQIIHDLRMEGELICSMGGAGGGYFYAANLEELEEYFDHELHPRAMDLLEQEKALRKSADLVWGVEQYALPLPKETPVCSSRSG